MEKLKMDEVFDEYMIEIFKMIELLPRYFRYCFGEKLKENMYEIKECLCRLYTCENKLEIINVIDADVNSNRAFLRFLEKNGYIKKNKMHFIMSKLNTFAYFVGKYMSYAQNDKK